jgi:CheY-like chemotaxis protein
VQAGAGAAERTTVYSGLGIGLTLARRLVQLHGGRIEADSEGPGRGSEFRLLLPLAHAAAPVRSLAPAATTATLAPSADASGRRILVVDDNFDGAQTLAELLRAMGHDTAVSYDGRDAVTQAERFRPHLVLLDLGLPLMDGHAVCRHVKAQPWGREIAIVALTGWGQAQDRERTAAAGFDGHLVKPAELDALLSLFERLWGRTTPPVVAAQAPG